MIVTDKEGLVVLMNPVAEELTAWEQDEALAKDLAEVFNVTGNETRPPVESPATKVLQDGAALWMGNDAILIAKDGRETPIDRSAAPIRDNSEDISGVILVFRDISGRKNAEEEKRTMQQQLQLAGRLAAVGEFAAGIAHELNNPLASVHAYAQLLNDMEDLDQTAKRDVQSICRETQRATRIASSLVSLASNHKPEKRFISINDTIEESLGLHAYRMKVNNIELVTHLAPDLPMTVADFHQMQQVFVNIVTNAVQAMTEAHGRGKLLVRTEKIGETIRITFADDGPGIPAENLDRIFDPFFTTKEVGEGTGLGLGICFDIVREHGGNMRAMNNPGKGATFIIELPIVSEHQDETEKS